MRPKRYPYIGNKKQPDKQIAKLKNEIAVCKTNLSVLSQQVTYLKTK